MISKLISGGQYGVDYHALLTARRLNIPTGGTAPKDYLVLKSNGKPTTNPDLKDFGLVEHSNQSFRERTIVNIENADGTALFGDMSSRGSRLAIRTSHDQGKPLICNPTAEKLRAWICAHGIKVLNVGGNRSRPNPEYNRNIAERLSNILIYALAEPEQIQAMPRCPDCGSFRVTEPDDEGFHDCMNCGLFFEV